MLKIEGGELFESMTEGLGPSSGHERSPKESDQAKFPTEAELRAFEEERERLGTTYGQLSDPYPIEHFARDPKDPTPDELRFMKEFNDRLVGEPLTFEEYFGYADPREWAEGSEGDSGPDKRGE